MKKRVEFRIPISPTESFFSQVRFFNFALRELGGLYTDALLRIAVGDNCDIDQVRRKNKWSEKFNIIWDRVPDHIFNESGIWGTANWRLNSPPDNSDLICLCDADTVLLNDINPAVDSLTSSLATVRGHMAHAPPPVSDCPDSRTEAFWPWLFSKFDITPPTKSFRYSMDVDKSYPMSPPYYNLGFVLMNPAALEIFGREIHDTELKIKALTKSQMRCQIAVTLIAYRNGMDIDCLSAEYNAANDIGHLNAQRLAVKDIRLLHYLRTDEVNRSKIFTSEHIDTFLDTELNNPANIRMQKLARQYRQAQLMETA